MISNQSQLEVTIEQLHRMYRALAALHAKIPRNSPQYVLLTEGPREEIERLRADIDEYLAVPVAHSSNLKSEF